MTVAMKQYAYFLSVILVPTKLFIMEVLLYSVLEYTAFLMFGSRNDRKLTFSQLMFSSVDSINFLKYVVIFLQK